MNFKKGIYCFACLVLLAKVHAAPITIGEIPPIVCVAHEMDIDTAIVQYYSFHTGQVTPINSIHKASTLLTACTGSKVLLKSPTFGKNANYKWTGPNGFTSYSSEIMLDEITSNHQGFYEISVNDSKRSIKGIIRLVVKESPELSLAQTIFSSQNNLNLAAKDLGENTTYTWLTTDGQAFASSREVFLSPHPAGKYSYKLAIEKDGCEVEDTFEIYVND